MGFVAIQAAVELKCFGNTDQCTLTVHLVILPGGLILDRNWLKQHRDRGVIVR